MKIKENTFNKKFYSEITFYTVDHTYRFYEVKILDVNLKLNQIEFMYRSESTNQIKFGIFSLSKFCGYSYTVDYKKIEGEKNVIR